MCSTNLLKLLPIEISIGIFRNYFTSDEKVKVLKDDYFWNFLSHPYAWREKPTIPWITLKGAAENLLNDIECGYYISLDEPKIIKVSKNLKRGSVIIEEFKHVINIAEISSGNKKPKVIKEFLEISQVHTAFCYLKSKYVIIKDTMFTDKFGNYVINVDLKQLQDAPYHTLLQIDNEHFFIYKKHDYLVLIIGKKEGDPLKCFSSEIPNDNLELLKIVCQIESSNCKNYIKTDNLIACKIVPWRKYFKIVIKTTFNYMYRQKKIKVTTRFKY